MRVHTRESASDPRSAILLAFADWTWRQSGYILARMPFEIVLAPEAVEDLKRLKANVRAEARAAIERHLRHEPRKVSRSRIKRLRGTSRPQFRLRAGEVRVFYDVSESAVEVLAIVTKSEAESWLEQFANPD
jgi:mRNA-degrading endonuclease RelE of RelBE toxin-antitoxin system